MSIEKGYCCLPRYHHPKGSKTHKKLNIQFVAKPWPFISLSSVRCMRIRNGCIPWRQVEVHYRKNLAPFWGSSLLTGCQTSTGIGTKSMRSHFVQLKKYRYSDRNFIYVIMGQIGWQRMREHFLVFRLDKSEMKNGATETVFIT